MKNWVAEGVASEVNDFKWGPSPPQVLRDQLTLSQPRGGGGILCLPHYYLPPGFSDLPTALISYACYGSIRKDDKL